MDGWLHGWMDGRWCRVLRVPPFQCEDLRGPCLYVCLLWGLSKVCGASTSRLRCLCDPAVARGMLSGEWQTGNATCHSTQVLATSAHSATQIRVPKLKHGDMAAACAQAALSSRQEVLSDDSADAPQHRGANLVSVSVVQLDGCKDGVVEAHVHAADGKGDGVGFVCLQGTADGQVGCRVPVQHVHHLHASTGQPALGCRPRCPRESLSEAMPMFKEVW